jgi:hypothetical protein
MAKERRQNRRSVAAPMRGSHSGKRASWARWQRSLVAIGIEEDLRRKPRQIRRKRIEGQRIQLANFRCSKKQIAQFRLSPFPSQSLNLYTYVRDLPTSKADPDGHCCWEELKSFGVGLAKELHNWAADTAANGIPIVPGVPTRMPLPAAIGESTGLTGMGTENGAQPVIESPSNKMETAGMVTVKAAPLVLAAVGVKAGVVEEAGAGAKIGTALPKEGIYEGADATAPGKTYVGQSGDIPNRIAQHEASGKFASGTKVTATEVEGGKTAREVAEHERIQQLGGVRSQSGSQTSNIRRPIGSKREHLLKKDQEAK